jgi:hypothetical protein
MIRTKPSPPPFLYNEAATELVRQNSLGQRSLAAFPISLMLLLS